MNRSYVRRLIAAAAMVAGFLPVMNAAQAGAVLRDGSRFLLESLGTVPGARWLDGRTLDGTVALAPRFGEPFSGTVWEAHVVANNVVALRDLGDIEGRRWLTCRSDTGAVTLSATEGATVPAQTAWSVQDFGGGVVGLRCGAAGAWLDGRTQTASVGLAPTTKPPFTGARWQAHEVRAADVLTNRHDNSRSGAYLAETVLSPALLRSGRFGKLFTRTVDGQIYGQPLFAEKLSIGGHIHNTVFVATTENFVYGFDADDETQSQPLWKSSQLGLPVPRSDLVPDTLIDPKIGIISTPVIDPASGTIFVVAKSKRIDVITDQADLASGDIITIQTAGTIPGPSWLNAITGNGTVTLAPQFGGDSFTGTWWQVERHANATSISFRSLGANVQATTPIWLDGRTADGTVGLAPNVDPPFTGASWDLASTQSRGFTMRTLGTIPGPSFLDGRTMNGTVALIQAVDAAHSGAIWRIQRHSYHNMLYALDMLTGRVKASTEIGLSEGGNFPQKWQLNRPGLLLSNGSIYAAFGAQADRWPWNGWIFAFRASDLHPQGSFNTTPGGFGAGLWQSGSGLATDEAGRIYVMTGNGQAGPGTPDLTNSFLQLVHDPVNSRFSVAGVMHAAAGQNFDMNVCDLDLGSSGPVHIPGTSAVIGGGKQGVLYNLDIGSLTHPRQAFMAAHNQYDPTPPTCVVWGDVMKWPHLHGAPVIWPAADGTVRVYLWAERDHLKSFLYRNGTFDTSPVAMSADLAPDMSMPGGVLSFSADGTNPGSGVVWATRPSDCPPGEHSDMNSRSCNAQFKIVPGTLKAFDAASLQQLWSSSSAGNGLGLLGKFNPPTVAHGRVYVGSFGGNCGGPNCPGQLVVYGVRPGT